MSLKNLKRFEGNKRGAPFILKPKKIHKFSFKDIPKLNPEDVNVVAIFRPHNKLDSNGNRNPVKEIVLYSLSDLPDDYNEQILTIHRKIKDYQTNLSNPSSKKTGAEITVKDMLNAYLISPKVTREKNYFTKKAHLDFFAGELGAIPLYEIKPKDIRNAKDKLMLPCKTAKNGDFRSGKTINNYLRSLRCAFEFAMKRYDEFDMNPVYFVETEVQDTYEHRVLTDEERKRLFEVIARRTSTDKKINKYGHNTSKNLHDFVTFGLWVGSRRGETLALKWNNIDFKRQEITFDHAIRAHVLAEQPIIENGEVKTKYNRNVRTKGLKNSSPKRTTSFEELPQIRELLLRRWSERINDNIFNQDCRTAWEGCLKEAKIENFRYQDLRKTCGTYLYQNDASLEQIAYYLGHKSTNTTELIYVRKDTDTSKQMGKLLQKRIK